MREILFKAKMKDNGEWVYGYLIERVKSLKNIGEKCAFIHGQKLIYKQHSPDKIVDYEYEVDPETVCQYTGLTNKNGKKIFEGDVLKYDDEEHWNVLYLEEDAMFGIVSDGIFEHFGDVSSFLSEVIGNIHDEE